MKPICIDLFCGLGGWTEGFLAEGYQVIGFDIEQHAYGPERYPGELVIQDVLTLHGSQLKDAACIVASPPCQKYSYMAQPWSRAKREATWQRWERDSPFGDFRLNDLFNACFRIQREASEAANREIPMVIENVKGAQPWVGSARWHYGSYYLWGDVPAIMPFSGLRSVSKNNGNGSWFNISHGEVIPGNQAGAPQRGDGLKTAAHANIRDGHSHTRHLTNQRESDAVKTPGISWSGYGKPGYEPKGFNVTNAQRYREDAAIKQHGSGPAWFDTGISNLSSRSDSRKAASAQIAKIPFELSSYIARVYRPSPVPVPREFA